MIPDRSFGVALEFTIEHLTPRARGGTNDLENLNGSHGFCNGYKGDSKMEELPREFRRFLKWKIRNLLIHHPKSQTL